MTVNTKFTYKEAKKWASSQSPKINGSKEWRERSKAKTLPPNMPAWPQGYYVSEFESWGEFLGTGTLAAIRRHFKPYSEARDWAQKQIPKITSKTEWTRLSKDGGIPPDIPKDPRNHYGADFKGWGEFLGTGIIANQCREMLSYGDLKNWVQEQTPIIYSREEYRRRVKQLKRKYIPSNPPKKYGEEFEGWAQLLGVRPLSCSSMIERMLKQELSTFLPVDKSPVTRLPVGEGKLIQIDIYIPPLNLLIEYDGSYFHKSKEKEDREKTKNLCLMDPCLKVIRLRERALKKLHRDDLLIKPGTDPLTLTKAVITHLLTLGCLSKRFETSSLAYLERTEMAGDTIIGVRWQSYENARTWAREQKLTNVRQWKDKSKEGGFLPQDIPAAPNLVYGDLFLGWSDFLGTPIVAPQHKEFMSYKEAREWAAENNVTTYKKWLQIGRDGMRPFNVPSNPQTTYKGVWRGWGEFFGSAKPKDTTWADFKDIKTWCASQSPAVRTFKQWAKIKNDPKIPKDFPKSLHYHFGAGAFERLRN